MEAAADRISPRVPHAHEKLNWEKEEKGRNGIKGSSPQSLPRASKEAARRGSEVERKPSESCGDGSSKPGNRIDKAHSRAIPRNLPPQKVSYLLALSATAGRLMEDCCSSNRP